ncbi:diacylglycerol kinase family protein [Candidatus Pelagibacter sp.]|jgi:diacylglycerol kinase (ATP)|nr:diacylglycerol kinase family protein [Candidatus Pelagibacter sp.]MDC0854079.1 diacylglycerol kinase family protein [Candidatus Pelagibacter sp.]
MLYCLIYNLNSSAGRKSKFINKVLSKLKKNNSVDYFETNTISQAKKIFKDFNKKNYDRLIVAGGDGSVSFAINELINNDFNFKDDFAIGYIPAGTANLLQAELSMNKKVDDIVNVLVSNNYKSSNLVKINENYFFLMAGIGWDAKIVHSINSKIKKILGKIIFGIKGFQYFLFMNNKKLNVTFDGQFYQADWILSSNTKYYAGHHKINKTNIFEDKLVTYIFKDLTRISLLYSIFLIILNGDLSKNKNVITTYSQNITIDGNDLIPVQIDGDNFGSYKKIHLNLSNKKVNFLVK